MAQFERTALPSQRIELQLAEIERTAREIQDVAATGIEARRKKAESAAANYESTLAAFNAGTVGQPKVTKAAEAFRDASNAVLPPTWLAAREALINAGLVRQDLVRGAADEAVEAALRAVNAWWRMRTQQYSKEIRYGFEGIKARSRGGQKRAKHLADGLATRNEDIRRTYRSYLAVGNSRADAIKLLAARYTLTTKTIRSIVPA